MTYCATNQSRVETITTLKEVILQLMKYSNTGIQEALGKNQTGTGKMKSTLGMNVVLNLFSKEQILGPQHEHV